MEQLQQNTKREICTITFISDESQHIDVIVTSHPNGNDLEKLAKSVLEALQALMQRNDPPNVRDHGARSAPVHPVVGSISESGHKP